MGQRHAVCLSVIIAALMALASKMTAPAIHTSHSQAAERSGDAYELRSLRRQCYYRLLMHTFVHTWLRPVHTGCSHLPLTGCRALG